MKWFKLHLRSNGNEFLVDLCSIEQISPDWSETDKDYQCTIYLKSGRSVDVCEFFDYVENYINKTMGAVGSVDLEWMRKE